MSDIVLKPEDIELLRNCVNEAVNSMYRGRAESDLRKEIRKKIKSKVGLSSKRFTQLVNIAFKEGGVKKFEGETTEILDMLDAIGLYKTDD